MAVEVVNSGAGVAVSPAAVDSLPSRARGRPVARRGSRRGARRGVAGRVAVAGRGRRVLGLVQRRVRPRDGLPRAPVVADLRQGGAGRVKVLCVRVWPSGYWVRTRHGQAPWFVFQRRGRIRSCWSPVKLLALQRMYIAEAAFNIVSMLH